MTFGEKVIAYHEQLEFMGVLPDKITMMNPFKESTLISDIAKVFYSKYYNDQQPRNLILGINPGRLGAGSTGIPFTDTKRLIEFCHIEIEDIKTHEPSSVFVYHLINAYGGVQAFYHDYYINSVCPLGFTITNEAGKEINYNYYDRKDLQEAVLPFIVENINKLIAMGCRREKAFCLGTGKNYKFLNQLNQDFHFFDEIVPLEHPRYIMQYKAKQIDFYLEDFVRKLTL